MTENNILARCLSYKQIASNKGICLVAIAIIDIDEFTVGAEETFCFETFNEEFILILLCHQGAEGISDPIVIA